MKHRQRLMLLYFGTLALTGCDAASDSLPPNEPTLVIPPGFEIEVPGQNISIRGFDECPSEGALMTKIFGSAPYAGAHDCIVLSEGRTTVPVRLFPASGSVVEDWEIIREVGETASGRTYKKTSLKRPDGTLVVPAIQ